MRLTQIRAVRRSSVPLLAAGLLFSGLVSTANADTITVTNSIPSFLTDATETASLPFFESAPGFVSGDVLTGVQIEFDATETIEHLNITNNAPSSETYTVSASGVVSSAGTPGLGIASIPAIVLTTFGPKSFTLAGGATIFPVPPPVSTVFDSGLVGVPPSPYDTTGTFEIGFTTSNGSSSLGGGNNDTITLMTDASGTVEAIYTFTPTTPPTVPEPASIFLLGSGLLLAGYLLRKRYGRA